MLVVESVGKRCPCECGMIALRERDDRATLLRVSLQRCGSENPFFRIRFYTVWLEPDFIKLHVFSRASRYARTRTKREADACYSALDYSELDSAKNDSAQTNKTYFITITRLIRRIINGFTKFTR